jgi:hypothetical protein
LKTTQHGLRTAFECHECVGIIEKRRISTDTDDYTDTFAQEAQRLLTILNGRIQTFLKERVKIFKTNNSKKNVFDAYKDMYSIALRVNETSISLPGDLYVAMERLKKIYEKHASD